MGQTISNCHLSQEEKKLKSYHKYISNNKKTMQQKIIKQDEYLTKQKKEEIYVKLFSLISYQDQLKNGQSYIADLKDTLTEQKQNIIQTYYNMKINQNWEQYSKQFEQDPKDLTPIDRVTQVDTKKLLVKKRNSSLNNTKQQQQVGFQSQRQYNSLNHQIQNNTLILSQNYNPSDNLSQISNNQTQLQPQRFFSNQSGSNQNNQINNQATSPNLRQCNSLKNINLSQTRKHSKSYRKKCSIDLPDSQYNSPQVNSIQQQQNPSKITNSSISHYQQYSQSPIDIEGFQNQNVDNSMFKTQILDTIIIQKDNKVKQIYNQNKIHNIFRNLQEQIFKNSSIESIIFHTFTENFYNKYSVFLTFEQFEKEWINYHKLSVLADLKFIQDLLLGITDILYKEYIEQILPKSYDKPIAKEYIKTEQYYLIMRFIYRDKRITQTINQLIEIENQQNIKQYQKNIEILKDINIENPFNDLQKVKNICFQDVIQRIKDIKDFKSPILKLEAMSGIKKDINKCIDTQKTNKDEVFEIDVDLYQNIIVYCIIKAQETHLYNEAQLILEYMPEQDLDIKFQAELNTLSQFQMALEYIIKLNQEEIDKLINYNPSSFIEDSMINQNFIQQNINLQNYNNQQQQFQRINIKQKDQHLPSYISERAEVEENEL